MERSRKELVLLRPRGFCAGVVRAVDAVSLALERFGPPIYVRHAIVHNAHVLTDLERSGAVFVDDLAEVPDGATVFFSAHGVSPAVRAEARRRELTVIDATCPLVSKVHAQAQRFARDGRTIILVGHRDHAEIEGTSGEAPDATIIVSSVDEVEALEIDAGAPVGYLTQTTLSLDDLGTIIEALWRRFPGITPPPSQDVCYATENRQRAVREAATRCDLILVVGSVNSSNSRSLVDVARVAGVRAALVDGPGELPWSDLEASERIGLTAGASTPEWLFDAVVDALVDAGYPAGNEVGAVHEDVVFAPPPGLDRAGSREILGDDLRATYGDGS